MADSPPQGVFKNTMYLTLAYIAQKVLTLAYSIMIARTYLPAIQGRYNTALAFTALFAVLIDLGLASVLTREMAQDKVRAAHYFVQVLMVRVVLGVVVYSAMLAVARLNGYPDEVLAMIALTGVATFFDVICTSCWAVWRGLHNLRYEAWGAILATTIMVGFGGTAMYLGLPIIWLAGAILLSSGAGLVYGLFLVVRRSGVSLRLRPDMQVIRMLLLMALPFALAAVCSRVYTFTDVVLVARIAGDEAAGWYSTANKIVLALQFLPAALVASTYPAMSSVHGRAHGVETIAALLFRAIRYLLILVVPMAVGLGLLAYKIIVTLPGEAYLPAVPMLQILAVALVFAFLIFPLGSVIAAIHRQTVNTVALAVGALLCVVGNLALIPAMGGVGAAVVSVGVYASIFVIEMAVIRVYWYGLWRDYVVLIGKIALATGVMAGMVWVVRDSTSLIVSILLGVVVYGGVGLLVRLGSWHEVRQIFVRAVPPPLSEPTDSV